MLIDTNTWLGSWPFIPLAERPAPRLAAYLREHKITSALVSHLGAVFQPDPMPANRALFSAMRRLPMLQPVPILNPALANWQEQLETCCAATPRLAAVRLLPTYHNYDFRAPRLAGLLKEIQARKIPLILTLRLDDRRHRYFALKIRDLEMSAVADFLGRFPGLHPLLSGIDIFELRALAKFRKNFSVETSFIERLYAAETLVREFSPTRMMFGSHTPFFVTASGIAKLDTPRLSAAHRAALEHGNAQRFFSL